MVRRFLWNSESFNRRPNKLKAYNHNKDNTPKISLETDNRKKKTGVLQWCINLTALGIFSSFVWGVAYSGYQEYYGEPTAKTELIYDEPSTGTIQDTSIHTINLFDALQTPDTSRVE